MIRKFALECSWQLTYILHTYCGFDDRGYVVYCFPISFINAAGRLMQSSSKDVMTSLVLEFGAIALEVLAAHSLLQGQTPWMQYKRLVANTQKSVKGCYLHIRRGRVKVGTATSSMQVVEQEEAPPTHRVSLLQRRLSVQQCRASLLESGVGGPAESNQQREGGQSHETGDESHKKDDLTDLRDSFCVNALFLSQISDGVAVVFCSAVFLVLNVNFADPGQAATPTRMVLLS